MKIDCVFSGGGVKAFAFIGALQRIEEDHLHIERVAGVSAGAIIGALVASGYTGSEIQQMAYELNTEDFLDRPLLTKLIPVAKWYYLYDRLGIYKGKRLEEWLSDRLAAKEIFTFSDLKEDALKVVVSDLTLGKLIVMPDDLERVYGLNPGQFPIAKAVRMSAGFPYFFMPTRLKGKQGEKSMMVDGGLLSNFPIWLFHNAQKSFTRPLLGVHITTETEREYFLKINNALSMLHALFSTMKIAHDERYLALSEDQNILSIPIGDITAMDMSISKQKKKELLAIGYESTSEFLRYWPN